MPEALFLIMFVLGLFSVLFLGWLIGFLGTAAWAWLRNENIEEAIGPWLAEL